MKKLYLNYIKSFEGLSKEVWWLALITLINRTGTMVIPFLSLYLTDSMDFGFDDVGWIMTSFGLGSFFGSYLGGKLTEKYGAYKVMFGSLFTSGILFMAIQILTTFWGFCLGIFVLMTVADTFRPAIFVALSDYSKPENKTRSLTLIRLAINLGFSAGPAIGGFIITTISYTGLFWIDGLTCLSASILLLIILNPKKAKIIDKQINPNPLPVKTDKQYLIFLIAMALFAFAFVQYFSAMPIYYRDVHHLTEFEIGLLMFVNGFTIAVFEMPLVKYFESKTWTNIDNFIIGTVLTALSFVFLNLTSWVGVLLIGMLFMTIGEMIAFPFSNAYALERSKRGLQGIYMGLYSMSFSFSHIFGHNSSLQYIKRFGFTSAWYLITFILILTIGILIGLKYYIKKHPN